MFKPDMKGPSRPAPAVPGFAVNRYSPITNWNDDPFGTDVFEPTPNVQKKKPPPRPPPPKITKQPDVPAKPSHFIRKPTVLSSLLSRKTKSANQTTVGSQGILSDFNFEVDNSNMFPKCEPKNMQIGSLIDLSSPPSSPTFTTRSSSDGLSVDSFGSDATTSTNHHNTHNGGNASQAESGFEDDFDLFLHSRKKEDVNDDITVIDPFSPQPTFAKPPLMKKPVITKDLFDISNNVSQPAPLLNGPTIIRAKPARPKPPDNSALLKNTFGTSFPSTFMNVNTTVPIKKINSGFGDICDTKTLNWCEDNRPEREASPPMPSIPPPPPPEVTDDDFTEPCWTSDEIDFAPAIAEDEEIEEPYAIALFDYFTDHPDDLNFSSGARIKLIRRIDHEWLLGKLSNGSEGMFPSNYVEVKVGLEGSRFASVPVVGSAMPGPMAVALYDLDPQQAGDLRLRAGDAVLITHKLNEQWYFGECNGSKGQFPINYVQIS